MQNKCYQVEFILSWIVTWKIWCMASICYLHQFEMTPILLHQINCTRQVNILFIYYSRYTGMDNNEGLPTSA